MANEATKRQLKEFFDDAYEKAMKPDERESQKKERLKRKGKASKKFGL